MTRLLVENPLRYLKNNILISNKNDFWAYYRVNAENIADGNTRYEDEKKALFEHVINELKNQQEFHLMLIPENLDLRSRFIALSDDFAKDLDDIPEHFAVRQIEGLEDEMDVVTRPSFYIGVKLKSVDVAESAKELLKQRVNYTLRQIYDLLGYDVEIPAEEWENVDRIEEDVYFKLKPLDVERISEDETTYINRYPYIRGTRHDVQQESSLHDIANIANTKVDPQKTGFLGLKNVSDSSVVSMIAVDLFQPDMEYSHLFKIADKFKFPVELNIKAKFAEKKGALGLESKVEGLRKRFKIRAQESLEITDDEGNRSKVDRFLTKSARDELEAGSEFLDWIAVFTVAGRTEEGCKVRGDMVISYLNSRKITSFRPLYNQLDLFYKMLPSASILDYNKWYQNSTVEGFSENLFAVTNVLGNNTGWVIGRINMLSSSIDANEAIRSSKKLVLWNQLAANKNLKGSATASPHIAITGETGKGKSFLSKVLFFYMTLMNAKALYIDPKKEFRKWVSTFLDNPKLVEQYPDYAKLLNTYHYITLDADDPKNHGALDPIVFLTGSTAKTTATAMLREIIEREYTVETELAINKAVDKIIERRAAGEIVGLLDVVDLLATDKNKEISNLGHLFQSKIENTILSLGFSHGETNGVNLSNRVNILEITGLKLPNGKSDKMTEVNRQSICLMLPLGKFCEKFGSDNKDEFSVEFFDEAWIFSKSIAGQEILEDMKRVGRSYNNTLIYTTQSVNDISADEGGQFGQVFAFDSREERHLILKLLDIEDSEMNIKRLASAVQGQCFYRDIYGHVDMMTVDATFAELMITNQTVTANSSSRAEEQFR
ncbi:ATP-binding protein [Lapidilactobacillus mulanensis]|uniref:ATP-binding protein n=1 Tax=Lapidilactobacillus mulanensis TaxID=2485999 RepID=A0ABW4DNU0_9LACO|nr:ATP-binding protein [Lapidilactobacillus mulanensis]